MTKSSVPRAGHTCMICNFAPTTKNKYRELQDHLVRKHFADRIKAALPTKRPYICPEPGCRLEGKDWQALMRHYTGKHNVLESFLKEVIQSGTVSLPGPIRKNVHYNKLSGLSNSALKQAKTNNNNNEDVSNKGNEDNSLMMTNNNNNNNNNNSNMNGVLNGEGRPPLKPPVKRKRPNGGGRRAKQQRPANLADINSDKLMLNNTLNSQPILTMLPLEPLSPTAAAAAAANPTAPPPNVARMMTVANLSEEQSQQLALVLKRPKANGEETVAFIDLRSFLASSTYIANPAESLKCVDSHLNVLAMPAAPNVLAEYNGSSNAGTMMTSNEPTTVYTTAETNPELLRPPEQLVLNTTTLAATPMESYTTSQPPTSESELSPAFTTVPQTSSPPNEWIGSQTPTQFLMTDRPLNPVELVEQQPSGTPLQLVVPQSLEQGHMSYATTTTATLPPMVQPTSILAAPDAPLELLEGDDGFFYLATADGQHLQIPVVNSVQVQSPTGEPMQVIQLGSQLAAEKTEMEQPLVLHSIPSETNTEDKTVALQAVNVDTAGNVVANAVNLEQLDVSRVSNTNVTTINDQATTSTVAMSGSMDSDVATTPVDVKTTIMVKEVDNVSNTVHLYHQPTATEEMTTDTTLTVVDASSATVDLTTSSTTTASTTASASASASTTTKTTSSSTRTTEASKEIDFSMF